MFKNGIWAGICKALKSALIFSPKKLSVVGLSYQGVMSTELKLPAFYLSNLHKFDDG